MDSRDRADLDLQLALAAKAVRALERIAAALEKLANPGARESMTAAPDAKEGAGG